MKIWLMKTSDVDYDLYQAAVVIARTRQEAEQISRDKLTNDPKVQDYYGSKFEQHWHAEEINLDKEGIVLADFNAG